MSLCSGSGEGVSCSRISAPFSRKYRIPHSYSSLSRIPFFVSKTHKLKKTNCCKRFKRKKQISRFNWYFYYEGEGEKAAETKREKGYIDGWVLTTATTLTTLQLLHLPQLVHLLRPLHLLHLLHLVVIMTWVWCGTIYYVLHQFHIKG